MKVVQELVAYFDAGGKLSSRQLKKLLDGGSIAADAPVNMNNLCDVVGQTFYFRVTGALEGQVWGSNPYTRDSNMGVAAVHAGLVKPGKSCVVRVCVVAAPDKYEASERNGVTTTEYGVFPHAWTISAI
jgi:hypothetical protein